MNRPPVGISSCLLGRRVRYDGGHKRSDPLMELAEVFRWVPVCPEVEIGVPTPREPMRLERTNGDVRMIAPATSLDVTESMRDYSAARVMRLQQEGICGYVFKSRSPSCGFREVPVFEDGELADPRGRGLFAQALASAMPSLPVEEETALEDPSRRAGFIERVLAYRP